MKNKRILLASLSLLLVISMPLMAYSHSGRTDGSGGHRDNKNKSGLGYYHYHCGGHPPHLHNGGVCPYTSASYSSSYSTPKTVYATKITPVSVPTTINAGESVHLEGSVYPTNAQDSSITWTSNNPEIITVTSSGFLCAVGIGTGTVTATTSRGTTSTFTITVNEVLAESIAIENKVSSMLLDDTIAFSVLFTPENTTNQDIEWTSNHTDILSVTADGNVTAKKLGTATITATHGELTDFCIIKVLPIKAESIEISFPAGDAEPESAAPDIAKGKQVPLKAVIKPENTTDKTVSWSVSDTSIAQIDENGVLSAVGSGTVTVIATTSNGLEAKIDIRVYSHTVAYVTGIGGGTLLAGGIYYFAKRRKKFIETEA